MAEIIENSSDSFVTSQWGNTDNNAPPAVITPPPVEETTPPIENTETPPVETTPPIEEKKEKSDEDKRISELAYRAKEAEKREKQARLETEMLRQTQTQNFQGMDQAQIQQVVQQAQANAEYSVNLRHLDRQLQESLPGDEYRRVVDNFNSITNQDPQFQKAVLESLFDEANAPEVIKHLVENSNELHNLYSLSQQSPHKMGKEIGKLAASINKQEQPAPKQVSKMPPPITQVAGGSTMSSANPNPEKMTIDEYRTWRIAERKKQGRLF